MTSNDVVNALPQQNAGLYPIHFYKGARIQLASGEIKCVEELTEEDFRRSTELSPDLKLDCSTVGSIEIKANHLISLIRFVLEDDRLDITVEAPVEHPFFVYSKGWCSVNPAMSLDRYKLNCKELLVGDVCVSLTLKPSPSDNLPTAPQRSSAYQGLPA